MGFKVLEEEYKDPGIQGLPSIRAQGLSRLAPREAPATSHWNPEMGLVLF